MSLKHSINVVDNITLITFTEIPTLQDLKDIIDELVDKYPYELRIWDLSNIKFDLTSKELIEIANYGKIKFLRPNRLAMITAQDLAFGEMREFQVRREEDQHSLVGVFKDREEGIAWLKLQAQILKALG